MGTKTSEHFCEAQDLICHIYFNVFTTGIPLIIAAVITAWLSFRVYKKQQTDKNNHILYAMWEETRMINLDCLQWVENYNGLSLKRKIAKDPEYQPYSVNYRTSKQAIEKLLHDMPGVSSDLVRQAFRYHYDDCIAVEIIDYINSDIWQKLNEHQKKSVIDDANRSMEALRISSKVLHRGLSKELKINSDKNVQQNTIPKGEIRV